MPVGCLTDNSGERLNGIQEVSGSIPLISTITKRVKRKPHFFGNEVFACLCGNAFENCFHAFKDLPHQLVNDTVQNVGGVACLPVALGLLAGFPTADIPHRLYSCEED